MEASSRVDRVLMRREGTSYVLKDPEATGYSLLAILGAGFALVGAVDLGLLWTPIQFGDPAWEFGTLSRTFDTLPMTGLGLGLLAFGLVRHPSIHPGLVRASAAVFGLAAMTVLTLGILYLTAAPALIRQAPPEVLDSMGRAIIKGVVQIATYVLALGLIASVLWRGVRKRNADGSPT